MNNKNIIFLILIQILFSNYLLSQTAVQRRSIQQGHFDMGFTYTLSGANQGWDLHVLDCFDVECTDGKVWQTNEVNIWVSPVGQNTINSITSFLGNVGDPVWVLPVNNTQGILFFGIGTKLIAPFTFKGPFIGALGTLDLTLKKSVGSGPDRGGQFAMWVPTIPPTISFSTVDGIDDSDKLSGITEGFHNHYNWSFTQPGEYSVEFEVTGTLTDANGGNTVAGKDTFNFYVPFTSNITTGNADFSIQFDNVSKTWSLNTRDENLSVAYASNQVFHYLNDNAKTTLSTDDINNGLGFLANINDTVWILPETASGSSDPVILGISTTIPTNQNNGDWVSVGVENTFINGNVANSLLTGDKLTLELVSFSGPGNFYLYQSNGASGQTVYMNTANNIDNTDKIDLDTNSKKALSWAFTEQGLYRLSFRVRGTLSADGSTTVSDLFTYAFGVGTPPDYNYATWADSYERTYSLTQNSLADETLDFDNDGIANRVEYALYWMGFDPVKPDIHLIPNPVIENGFLFFDYIRDTYKDPGTLTPVGYIPEFSTDLKTWTNWNLILPTNPDDVFTGITNEKGTAFGFIQQRRIRLPITNENNAYIRLSLIKN